MSFGKGDVHDAMHITRQNEFLPYLSKKNPDPEYWHEKIIDKRVRLKNSKLAANFIKGIMSVPGEQALQTEHWGIEYKNPLGVAAGFSKNAEMLHRLEAAGFGYITVGSVLGKSQDGNPRQRIRRNNEECTIRNKMGLPYQGIETTNRNIEDYHNVSRNPVPIHINLANHHDTKNEDKGAEFVDIMGKTYTQCTAYELNFSCPNQAGANISKNAALLKSIILAAQKANESLAMQYGITKKPIIIKIAPLSISEGGSGADLSLEQLYELLEVCVETKVDGITLVNTSNEYEGRDKDMTVKPAGGMSGLGLHQKALKTVSEADKKLTELLQEAQGHNIVILGVGGIGAAKTPTQVKETIINMKRAGADMFQMYSGFIVGSPVTPAMLKAALIEDLQNS